MTSVYSTGVRTYKPGGHSFAHQREGLRRIIAADGVYALLWDPGTGKTKVVIDYLGWLAFAAQAEVRVLVVCPKAVTDSWVTQANQFMGQGVDLISRVIEGSITEKANQLAKSSWAHQYIDGKVDASHLPALVNLQVINLEALSSRRPIAPKSSKLHSDLLLESVKKFAPHVLVVDESHRIKGRSSNSARLLARMAKTIKRRLLLTGTPMPHSPLDVWSQWRVLAPEVFATNGNPWSFGHYQGKYAILGGYMGKEVKGFQYLDDLEERMSRNSMVLRKEDALDLPPVTEIMVPVTLSAAERKAYDTFKRDLLLDLDKGEIMSAATKLTMSLRLRQITSGFVKPDNEPVQYIGDSRQSVAMDLLEDLMATEHRVVIFAWARPEVDRLVETINKSNVLNGAKAYAITGDTPDDERLRLRQNFAKTGGSDRLILVCQARTVSLGVNEFVSASHAVFLSLSQQRDDLIQAKGRLDRQGQTKPVTFWMLQAPGTIDEVIYRSHMDRTSLEDAVLAHIRSTG